MQITSNSWKTYHVQVIVLSALCTFSFFIIREMPCGKVIIFSSFVSETGTKRLSNFFEITELLNGKAGM